MRPQKRKRAGTLNRYIFLLGLTVKGEIIRKLRGVRTSSSRLATATGFDTQVKCGMRNTDIMQMCKLNEDKYSAAVK